MFDVSFGERERNPQKSTQYSGLGFESQLHGPRIFSADFSLSKAYMYSCYHNILPTCIDLYTSDFFTSQRIVAYFFVAGVGY